jgi:hypothetical protein
VQVEALLMVDNRPGIAQPPEWIGKLRRQVVLLSGA